MPEKQRCGVIPTRNWNLHWDEGRGAVSMSGHTAEVPGPWRCEYHRASNATWGDVCPKVDCNHGGVPLFEGPDASVVGRVGIEFYSIAIDSGVCSDIGVSSLTTTRTRLPWGVKVKGAEYESRRHEHDLGLRA